MKKKHFASVTATLLCLVLTLTACNTATVTPTTSPSDIPTVSPTAAPAKFSQSPILEGKDLPKIQDRLPKEPKLTNEYAPDMLDYEIGQYGGTLKMGYPDLEWHPDAYVMMIEGLLNTPGMRGEEVTGNVLKGYEVNADSTQFTFFMRDGLKWSDGAPVTMEDIRFTYEDILMNPELTPAFPIWMKSGGTADGTPFVLEIVDDFTYKMKFDKPYGGFLMHLSIVGWKSYADLLKPSHFLKPYHKDMPEYDETRVNEVATKNNIAEDSQKWVNVFNFVDIVGGETVRKEAKGFPSLQPWSLTETKDNIYTYARNPYYFKVDSQGNQLPYIDALQGELVQDMETNVLKMIAGDFDYAHGAASLINVALFKENEKNGYKTLLVSQHTTPTDFFINMTYNDETFRSVVGDIRFRQALNYSIDREEIIDTVYYGYAAPSTIQDSEFNIDKATALLDEMKMDKKDKDGMRLAPNGKPFELLIEVAAEAPDIIPTTELLVEMFRSVGINAKMKRIESSLMGNKNAANELQARVIWTHTPLWYMQDWGFDSWGRAWNIWRTNSKEATITKEDGTIEKVALQGEEPDEKVKEFYNSVNKLLIVNPKDAQPIVDEIHKSMKENLWYFTYIKDIKKCVLVDEKMGNYTENGFSIGMSFGGEQLFFKK